MKTKGVNILILKKMLRERGGQSEQILMAGLSPQALDIYTNVLATTWVPMQEDSEIKIAAGRLFFPQDPQNARHFQCAVAKKSLTGIYKIFIRIPSIPYIIKSTAKLWSTFWQKGEAHMENLTDKRGTVVVTDFPELIPAQHDLICGYIMGIIELTNAHNIQASINDKNPHAWKWSFSWQ